MPSLAGRGDIGVFDALDVLERAGIRIEDVALLLDAAADPRDGAVTVQHPSAGFPIEDGALVLVVLAARSIEWLRARVLTDEDVVVDPEHARYWKALDAVILKDAYRAWERLTRWNLQRFDDVTTRVLLDRWFGISCVELGLATVEAEAALKLRSASGLFEGTVDGLATYLGYVLDVRIEVVENRPVTHRIDDLEWSRLGRAASRLGVDWVLGRSNTECVSRYRLRVGPLLESDVTRLVAGRLVQPNGMTLEAGVKLLALFEVIAPFWLEPEWEFVRAPVPSVPWRLGRVASKLGSVALAQRLEDL